MKLLIALTLLVLTACAPKSSGNGSDPAAPGAPVAHGTGNVGGGGNGIDDKMLESFSIRIDTLPEFKRYIEPVIRKIARGRGDIMTTYMNYAVHNKPWYMIPRPLENLSKEQIGAAFPTDQFALHSDERVYIAQAFYSKMNQKERANLLMHEIVMGARLLMKKTPKEQCEKLAGANINACSDPEMMKLAEAQDISDSQRGTMDDHDHDAVKAMTIFLMQRVEDVTADSVGLKRRELGFIFPWDKAISNLTLADVGSALKWSQLADVVLVPKTPPVSSKGADVACLFDLANQSDDFLSIHVLVSDTKKFSSYSLAQAAADPLWGSHPSQLNFGKNEFYNSFSDVIQNSSFDTFEARGVVDPTNPKRVVDLVRLRPSVSNVEVTRIVQQPESYDYYRQLEVWLTREENPQIVQIVARKLKVKISGSPDMGNLQPEDWQWVPSQNEEARCLPKSAAP